MSWQLCKTDLDHTSWQQDADVNLYSGNRDDDSPAIGEEEGPLGKGVISLSLKEMDLSVVAMPPSVVSLSVTVTMSSEVAIAEGL